MSRDPHPSSFWIEGPARLLEELQREEAELLREIDERLRRAGAEERPELEERRRVVVVQFAEKRRQIGRSLF